MNLMAQFLDGKTKLDNNQTFQILNNLIGNSTKIKNLNLNVNPNPNVTYQNQFKPMRQPIYNQPGNYGNLNMYILL